MKKVLTTIALSLSAFMATTAMAAPDHRDHDRRAATHYKHQDSRWDRDHDRRAATHYKHQDSRWDRDHKRPVVRVNPSRDWRVGQTLPRAYDQSRYKVSDREARRLPNTGRYQQWYKINGDYVMINERTNRIIRIMG